MKKSFLFLILFLMPVTLYAYNINKNPFCNNEIKMDLRREASNILYDFEKDLENGEVYFTLIVSNINDNLILIDEKTETKYTHDFLITNNKPGDIRKFKIYASNKSDCRDELVFTKNIKMPFYNKFSQHEICKGYENEYLCVEEKSVNLSEKEFVEKMEKYIESLNKKNEEEPKKEESKTFFEKTYEFLLEHYIKIIIGIAMVVGISISISYIIKKRKYDF